MFQTSVRSAAVLTAVLFIGLGSCRQDSRQADPFVGLWEFASNDQDDRRRYLSITVVDGEYAVLRADSAYAENAAVARGRAAGSGASQRVEVAFPDGERYSMALNGSNELVVSFYKTQQPEDITLSYVRGPN